MQIIKDSQLIDDQWTVLAAGEAVTSQPTEQPLMVAFSDWPVLRKSLLTHGGPVGVQLEGDAEVEQLAEDLPQLQLITINFGTFVDGRGYSLARLLRQRLGYTGEIRAVGEVLADQAHLMAQVGINAFEISDQANPEAFIQAELNRDLRQQMRLS